MTQPGFEWSLASSPRNAWKTMPSNGTGLDCTPVPGSASTTRVQTVTPVCSSNASSNDTPLTQAATYTSPSAIAGAPITLPPSTNRLQTTCPVAALIARTLPVLVAVKTQPSASTGVD